jgi:8-oxo-dGTP diphosphatase
VATGEHERPMLTVDTVVLADAGGARRVLLVQRANPPFQGAWALPGGFVDPGEQVAQAAPRELAEETGVQLLAEQLRLLGVYDTPGRDPRGWTVSVVYLVGLAHEPQVGGAADAADARWFDVDALPALAFDHALILADALSA